MYDNVVEAVLSKRPRLLFLAKPHQCRVYGYPVQPGGDLGLAPEAFESSVRRDECFLSDVFCVLWISHHAKGHIVHEAGVFLDDPREVRRRA
jgi:hypothetical protein